VAARTARARHIWCSIAEHEAHRPADGAEGLPQVLVVEVAVLRDPEAHPLALRIAGTSGNPRRHALATLGVVLATVAVGMLWLGNRNIGPLRMNVAARGQGSTGLAAADDHPPVCLSVVILSFGSARARTDGDHQIRCGRHSGYATPIFRYVEGAWRPVLNAISYLCPAASLPASGQTRFDVCLPTRADRLALDR